MKWWNYGFVKSERSLFFSWVDWVVSVLCQSEQTKIHTCPCASLLYSVILDAVHSPVFWIFVALEDLMTRNVNCHFSQMTFSRESRDFSGPIFHILREVHFHVNHLNSYASILDKAVTIAILLKITL